ncbi:hypothetical protein BLOT_016830 [Blomia tropicalis]|nr:hypothetical protein BLOT_016830 [Blomia tropicalis]
MFDTYIDNDIKMRIQITCGSPKLYQLIHGLATQQFQYVCYINSRTPKTGSLMPGQYDPVLGVRLKASILGIRLLMNGLCEQLGIVTKLYCSRGWFERFKKKE